MSQTLRGLEFYRKTLGMKLLYKTPSRARINETRGRVARLISKGSKQILELNWYPRQYKYGGKSGPDHLAFEVKDAAAEYRRLSKKHGRGLAPFEEERWLLAYIKDPDGNCIELGSKLKQEKRHTL
jgi:catechol 2,3-dioxygenase-like lactoylglutathione lyase family enzyme